MTAIVKTQVKRHWLKAWAGIISVALVLAVVLSLVPVEASINTDSMLSIGLQQITTQTIGEEYKVGDEIVDRRGETSKTYYLGYGGYRYEMGGGIQHWKYDYEDEREGWKEVDLRWDGTYLDTAPYILEVDGTRLSFQDRKTGERTVLELISSECADAKSIGEVKTPDYRIVPFNTGVHFQHYVTKDNLPFEAQFRVEGKIPVSRAYDDIGQLALEVSYDEKTGVLTERLTEIRDADSKELREVSGEIRIDPTLTVQPSAKDTRFLQANPTTNYGTGAQVSLRDLASYTERAVLEFSLSGLPAGATVDTATLSLYQYLGYGTYTGKSVGMYKLLRTDWVETQATWNIYKTGSNWDSVGGDYVTSNPSGATTSVPGSYGWMSWNVKGIVEDAIDNEGWSVAEFLMRFVTEGRSSGDGGIACYSNDYTTDTSKCPKLVIEYTLAAPAAPTNVAATDGTHTDKVVVTWTKSDGATGYKVYEGANLLDTLGDVDTYNDTAAPAPTITPGSTIASDGTSTAHVALSLEGATANDGASRTYKVVAFNDAGDSPDSDTDTGYRGVGALTYQWQRSAGSSPDDYSDIDGATGSTHNDTGAPAPTIMPGSTVASDGTSPLHVSLSLDGASTSNGATRYYRCVLNATGASQETSAADSGYRGVGALTYQWQRSAGASNENYSDIDGATGSTHNDTAAPAPTISAGNATASDGTSTQYVTLTLANHQGNAGEARYYQCVLNADGASEQTSAANDGYRGTDDLAFQWHQSAGDSDDDYSDIVGATTNPYNDTEGAIEPDGRYYQCAVSMSGATSQNSTSDRGYRLPIIAPTVVSYNATGITSESAQLHGEITDTGNEDCHTRGFEWGFSSGNYTGNWTASGSFGTGTFDRVITGLPYNTEVFWRAYATNTAGHNVSAECSFWTLTICYAPTDFTITQIGPTSINVTWTMGIGADSTIIRVSEGAWPTDVNDGYLSYNGSGTFVVIDGLMLSNTVYYFRAWSENIHGVSADYAQASIGADAPAGTVDMSELIDLLVGLIEGPTGIVNMMFAVALMGFAFWKKGWLRVMLAASLIIWGTFTIPYDIKIAAPFIGVGTLLFVMGMFQVITTYRETRQSRSEAAWTY